MPRLSLGLGVQAVNKVKSGGGAPSGIPVASTTSVVITNGDLLNGTAIKKTVGQMCWGVSYSYNATVVTGVIYSYNLDYNQGAMLVQPQATASDFLTPSNNWQIVYTTYDTEAGELVTLASATNPSTDPTTIPTTGWSPSITITAA
jgi:hypothetical protein